MSAYTTAKAGVDMFVRSAAEELGSWRIRVNSVRRGRVGDEVKVAGGATLIRQELPLYG